MKRSASSHSHLHGKRAVGGGRNAPHEHLAAIGNGPQPRQHSIHMVCMHRSWLPTPDLNMRAALRLHIYTCGEPVAHAHVRVGRAPGWRHRLDYFSMRRIAAQI